MSDPSRDLDVALAALAEQRPLLLACDYDGVLSPLVDDPSAAGPEPGAGEALARLAAVDGVTVALVSGRGVADLQRTSGFTGPYRWVGSHGAEFDGPLTGELAARRDRLVELLEPVVAGAEGAWLEVKPASVAVHVRKVPDRAMAADVLERARAIADSSLTMKPGKDVLELAVTDADKGAAVLRLASELDVAAVAYFGDDVTDEDAFRALGPGDLTVKVGEGPTVARFRVADPAAVRDVLERLADLLG